MLGSNPSAGAVGSTDAEVAALCGGLCFLSSGCPQSDKSQGAWGTASPIKSCRLACPLYMAIKSAFDSFKSENELKADLTPCFMTTCFQMWEAHGWVAYSAIVQARAMYKGGPFDPNKAYDVDAAKVLIKEQG